MLVAAYDPLKKICRISSCKLELRALKWAVTEQFRSYLLGAEIQVYTDNNPLCYLQTAKLGAVEQRWAAKLALFKFKIKYRPGRANGNADALSRMTLGNCKEPTPEDYLAEVQTSEINVTHSTPVPVELRETATENIDQVQPNRGTLKTTFTTLPSHSLAELRDMQRSDPVIGRFWYYWPRNQRPTPQERRRETKDTVTLLNQWDKMSEEDGLLYRVIQDPRCGQHKQLVLPQSKRESSYQPTQ